MLNPSIERFVYEIVHAAKILVATHNNFAGTSLGDRHQHPALYQISYYLKGQDRVFAGQRRYAAKEGDLFFIPPHCWHGSEPAGKQARFEMLQVKFGLKQTLPLPMPVYIHVKYPADFLFVFHALVNEFHMQRPQRETVLRLDLARLVLLVRRLSLLKGAGYHLSSLNDAKLTEERITKVIRYIQANYSRPLPLAAMAGAGGCGVSTFAHAFKRHTGISPVSYLINYRLSKALDLMANTDKKLEDIASETGFSSVYYFSRLFLKRYNQSPRRYARLIYNAR